MPDKTDDGLKFDIEVTNPETKQPKKITIVSVTNTRGRAKGSIKLQPLELKSMTIADWVSIWGDTKFLKFVVQPRINQLLSNFTREATTKEVTKEVNGKVEKVTEVETDVAAIEDEFTKLFGSLSARGDSVMALKRRLTEILDEYSALMNQFMETDTGNIEAMKKIKDAIAELKLESSEIKQALAEKKAADEKDEEEVEEKVAA